MENGYWKVFGSDANYNIRIIEPILLTGVSDPDMHILAQLDDKILGAVCRVNKYTASLCQNDAFWALKIEVLHPGFPIPKDYNNRKKELYLSLTDYDVGAGENLLSWAIKSGYLEILKWSGQNQEEHHGLANDAAACGQLEILQWLAKGNYIYSHRSDRLGLEKTII